ncbi:MAG: hypothetical protein ACTHNU_10260 [Gaiellales bacterium]
MTEAQERSAATRAVVGGRLGGFIYGTIVVLSVIVSAAQAFPHQPGKVAGFVAVTTIVFWLAHVYAHALAHAVGHDEHLSLDELRMIAYRERSIIEAGVPSIVALLAGEVGLVSETVAVWVAILLGIAMLTMQGLRFAQVERLSRLGTAALVAGNLGLGLTLVGLKLLVTHF